MPASFRPIRADEVDRALALMARLYAHDAIPFDATRARGAIETLLTEPEFGGVWWICAETEPVGYLVLLLGYSLEFGGRYGLLDELFVEEAWQGRGLGREALAFAERECRARGWHALRLEVDQRNERAMALYRRAGLILHDRYLMTKWM